MYDEIAGTRPIIHSVDDEMIPFYHGVDLFKEANDPKMFLEINGSHYY